MEANTERKFIYAKQVDCEDGIDFEAYCGEDMLESRHIAIFGNKDFCDLNNFKDNYERKLNDCKYDLNVAREDLEDEQITEEEFQEEVNKTVNYYFTKDNKKELSQSEIRGLIKACDDFYACTSSEEDNEIICRVLEIIYDEPFIYTSISGCCQGDWMRVICPQAEKETLPFVEAVYFGTGTEFMITDNLVANREEAEEAFDNGDCYYDYTEKYSTADVKQWVADNARVDVSQVKVLTITGSRTYVKYDYEEE